MAKYKKIRGINRRLKAIKDWREKNLFFDKESLLSEDCLYLKFRVDPWSRLSLTNSDYPEPNHQFREMIIEAFSDIYDLWKEELDKLNLEYYLKIWIIFPHFRESQLVCAINDKIDWYNNVFAEGEDIVFPKHKFSEQSNKILNKYNWKHVVNINLLDEENYVGDEQDYVSLQDYEEVKKRFERFLKTEHKTVNIDGKIYHIEKICDIWVGDKNG